MERREVELAVDGWTALLPERRADNADWIAGCNALAAAAVPAYNASVQALRGGDLDEAVHQAGLALRYLPYCPHLLEYGLALTLEYGDHAAATGILSTAQALGLGDQFAEYEAALQRGRTEPRSDAAPDRSPLPREAAQTDAPPSQRSWAAWRTVTLAVAIGLLGLIGGWMLAKGLAPPPEPVVEGTQEPVSPPPDTQDAEADRLADAVRPYLEVVRLLGQQEAAAALSALHDIDQSNAPLGADDVAALEAAAATLLTQQTRPLWLRREDERLVQNLRPLVDTDTLATPEGLYWLGVAAEAQEQDTLAVRAYRRFLDHPEATDYAHYRGQAAYSSAMLASSFGEARPYARIIRRDYAGSLYDNSLIAAVLQ